MCFLHSHPTSHSTRLGQREHVSVGWEESRVRTEEFRRISVFVGLFWVVGFKKEALTCELQRATQLAVCWSQQRQAGVFGVGVLQTLHQRNGCVLHKLHQQLERNNTVMQQGPAPSRFPSGPAMATNYLWLGVKLIRKHGSPFAEPAD